MLQAWLTDRRDPFRYAHGVAVAVCSKMPPREQAAIHAIYVGLVLRHFPNSNCSKVIAYEKVLPPSLVVLMNQDFEVLPGFWHSRGLPLLLGELFVLILLTVKALGAVVSVAMFMLA